MSKSSESSIANRTLDTAISLSSAIHDAGGYVNVSDIMDMSVRELILTVLSPNNIIFKYDKLE